MHVVIIGAGWAGLAAAIKLSRHPVKVTLIEAARQAGGRARSIQSRGATFDNGQHLMVGAYKEMLRLLSVIGVSEQQALRRIPLHLDMRSLRQPRIRINFPALPAPLHVIAGFLRAEGLAFDERRRALALCTHLAFSGFTLDSDISAAEWLHQRGQPPHLIKALWEPLCLAALNTPIEQASAQIFINMLREVFAGPRRHSNILLPRADLSAVFPDPAIHFLRQQGVSVQFNERALALDIQNHMVRGVITRQEKLSADHVIIAVSPGECLRLIEPLEPLQGLAHRLAAIHHEPICTVYLQYPPEIRLGESMVGLLDGTGQWIFDLGAAGQPGRMAVVISGPGPHMEQDNAALIELVRNELTQHFPQWPQPSQALVIRERRATFSCRPEINSLRPSNKTPLRGCWLAGDYTNTGLSATLEGALRSGVRCAQEIIATF